VTEFDFLLLLGSFQFLLIPQTQPTTTNQKMSCRLGAIALVLALCAVSVHSQVWGYVSQSFSLVRSDILEAADYELVANISNRDAGEV
jgi:hypothetical protein